MKTISRLLTTVLLLALLALATSSAWGATAANTRILNSATLHYNDATGAKTATAQVTVIVAVKGAVPTITPVSDQFGPYATPLVDSYYLTNNGNGPDTFDLTTATNTPVNGTISAVPGIAVLLGATVTIAGSYNTPSGPGQQTVLVVPSDGTANSSINELVVGDTIVINNQERVIKAITDNANGTSKIEVDVLSSNYIPGAGVIIGERKTVQATVTPSNVGDPAQNVTGNVKMTATSQADTSKFAQSTDVANTFYPYTGSLTKYVRNTDTNTGTGTSIQFNGLTYYRDSAGYKVEAKPGEYLEYLLLASAVTPTQSLSNVVLTDLVPTEYVTLTTSVVDYGGKAFRYYPDASATGTFIDYTATTNNDAVDYNPAFLADKGEIKAWIGGAAPLHNIPGTIAGGKSIILLYQVQVKP